MDESDKSRTLLFLEEHWPPGDSFALYHLGRVHFPKLGKIPSIRAVLAVFECRVHGREVTDYERTAVCTVEDWVVEPTDAKRTLLGQLAGMQEPGYSFARNLANMASRSEAWRSAVAFNLTGNPNALTANECRNYCDAIETELTMWATNAGDPVADRFALRNED